jgi:hypothetical protein
VDQVQVHVLQLQVPETIKIQELPGLSSSYKQTDLRLSHSCHVPGTMGTRDGNGGRESLLATNREQLGYTSL